MNSNDQSDTPSALQIVDTTIQESAITMISKAEIDMQISTAKKYPRALSIVKRDMISFATLDVETAATCFYTVPRAGKNIQGPSVRLAEIAVSCYGNLRVQTRIVDVVPNGNAPHVVVQAVCHDLERNVAVCVEKRRRITGRKSQEGKIDEDAINLAANAGMAIAFRDAVYKVIPGALIKPVYENAKQVAIGDAKTLGDRRAKAIESFAKMGVTSDRVLTMLGRGHIEEVQLTDLEVLIGLYTAIKDGQASIDDSFPPEQRKGGFGMPTPPAKERPAAPAAQPVTEKQPAPTPTAPDETAATSAQTEPAAETQPELTAQQQDNDTPQRRLHLALNERKISEGNIMGFLKTHYKIKQLTVNALPDALAGEVLRDLDVYLDQMAKA
jgi:hypothetical protein